MITGSASKQEKSDIVRRLHALAERRGSTRQRNLILLRNGKAPFVFLKSIGRLKLIKLA